MKRHYECMFIIAGNVAEDKRNEIIAKFSKMAGSDCMIEKWGMRKFATPIGQRKEGFYVLFNFSAEPEVPAQMTTLMNITDGILRSMFIVKNEKQLAADASRKQARAQKFAQKAEAKPETPAK